MAVLALLQELLFDEPLLLLVLLLLLLLVPTLSPLKQRDNSAAARLVKLSSAAIFAESANSF